MTEDCRSEIVSVGPRRVFNDYCAAAGSRRTYLLVHGIGVSHRYFKRLARQLAKTDAVYALDLPGYGRVSSDKVCLDIEQLAAVVAEFIRQEGIQRPILVGHSMGCQIIARLAVAEPALVDKLILLDPTVDPQERNRPLQAWRLLQDSLREPWQLNMIVITDYFRFGFRRYWKTSRYMINDVPEEYLPAVTVPSLVVRGSHDPIARRRWAEQASRLLPKGSLAEVAGAGHVVQFKRFKEIAELCRRFTSDA